MSDLISISEAARKLGINRSVLNRHINSSEIEKTKSGRSVLISYVQVCDLVQKLAVEGHLRAKPSQNRSNNKLKDTDDLIQILKDELKVVREERDQLHKENKKLLAENGELKLLKAGSTLNKTKKSFRKALRERVNQVIDFMPDL